MADSSSSFLGGFDNTQPQRLPEQNDEIPRDISVVPDTHIEENTQDEIEEIESKIREIQNIINEEVQRLCYPEDGISQSEICKIKESYLEHCKELNELYISYHGKTDGMTNGKEKRKDCISVAKTNERFVDIFRGKAIELFLSTLKEYRIKFPRLEYCNIENSTRNTYEQLFGQEDFGVFCATKSGNVFGIFFHCVKPLSNQTCVCYESALFIIRRNGMKEYIPKVSKRGKEIQIVFGNNENDELMITVNNSIGDSVQFSNNRVSIVGDIHNIFNEIEYNAMLLNRNSNNEYQEEINELKVMKIN
ncbi:hypothetical protein ENUP19_0219G0013 [Entamoeba nuttalli]|uniref:TLDc domain-containing protein n=1 Tax=Entamoeba nuttalli TaxID=412467 RepID=A0ABQ0DPK8_9EUKA